MQTANNTHVRANNCLANAGKYALTFEIQRPILNCRRDLLQITAKWGVAGNGFPAGAVSLIEQFECLILRKSMFESSRTDKKGYESVREPCSGLTLAAMTCIGVRKQGLGSLMGWNVSGVYK